MPNACYRTLIMGFDALLSLVVGVLLLAKPQFLTKKSLDLDENQKLAKLLKVAGILAVFAGITLFLVGFIQRIPK